MGDPSRGDEVPRGFNIRRTLRGDQAVITRLAWSPDGRMLASGAGDSTIRIWDAETGGAPRQLKGQSDIVYSVAWSRDGLLASSAGDHTILLWRPETGERWRTLEGYEHDDRVFRVAWSPDGQTLASGSADNSIRLWDAKTGKQMGGHYGHFAGVNDLAWSPDGRRLASGAYDQWVRMWSVEDRELGWKQLLWEGKGHTEFVSSLAWSPDGRMLASGSADSSIQIWDPESGRPMIRLEGHAGSISGVAFSADSHLLASKSKDNKVRLWRTDRWETVAILPEEHSTWWEPSLAFHPEKPVLATLGEKDTVVRIWELDLEILLGEPSGAGKLTRPVYYTNAKVVLVGEASTGKTCLAQALMGEPFAPQESTHGMRVWTFQTQTDDLPDGSQIVRETMLWDLAGQPDYHIIHQLFLDKTALGIILFNPADEGDSFRGVGFWEKALRRVAGDECPRLLVAGRVDRGYPTATPQDIEAFRTKHEFAAYIPTSAKMSEGIKELKEVIARAIPWEKLARTSSPRLFELIREYLIGQRKEPNVLTTRGDLRGAFRRKHKDEAFTEDQFDTVIGHVQAQGLVWRFSFGDYVLMRPELLNDYASAVVRVARKHPEGLGCVEERAVLDGRIDFMDLKRIWDREKERWLLHTVVELCLAREVAYREGEQLVFPSKFNREHPEHPKPPRCVVAYRFAGPVAMSYATLAVRLYYCGSFRLAGLWKNAAEFRDPLDHLCGFLLHSPEEGQGVLSIYFEEATGLESRALFENFISKHLDRRALPRSTVRERIYRCPKCQEKVVDRKAIVLRIQQGRPTIPCLYCEDNTPIVLLDDLEKKFGDPELVKQVRKLEQDAEEKKEQAKNVVTFKAKEKLGEFDVFLAHNNKDKPQVEAIGAALKLRGLNLWLDKEQVPPGRWFQDVLQTAIGDVKSAAIILGPHGLGNWQTLEMRTFVSQCVELKKPVIPVLLPGVDEIPEKLLFLRELNPVRFQERIDEIEALDLLEWGIRGERSRGRF